MMISIPPIYKLFYRTLEVGEDTLLEIDAYLDPLMEGEKTLLLRGGNIFPGPKEIDNCKKNCK